MALDFAKLTKTAVQATKKAGATATATITRNPVPNSMTGTVTGSPIPQTVDVIQADAYRHRKASDAAWTSANTALFVSALSVLFTPLRGDTVTFAGKTGRIVALDEYSPAGPVIGWFLGVGT
jgi:hypothetical protein